MSKETREYFKRKWIQANYPKTMGSAVVMCPPPPDMLPLYHLTSTEHAISDIKLKRMKVARLNDLNDPFELFAARLNDKPIRKLLTDFKNEQHSKIGLLCFSRDWTNPVLWSHYGARHKGVCLGFRARKSSVHHVTYRSKRLAQRLSKPGLEVDEKLKQLLLHTKFSHWKYESELRRVLQLCNCYHEDNLHFVEFDNTLELKEFILGPECELDLDEMRSLFHKLHPQAFVFRARRAWGSFHVVPMESSVDALHDSPDFEIADTDYRNALSAFKNTATTL